MSFFGEPIGNAISRMQEHAADAYGLQLIQGFFPNANEVAAHSFQVLGEEDLDDPTPPNSSRSSALNSHPASERPPPLRPRFSNSTQITIPIILRASDKVRFWDSGGFLPEMPEEPQQQNVSNQTPLFAQRSRSKRPLISCPSSSNAPTYAGSRKPPSNTISSAASVNTS